MNPFRGESLKGLALLVCCLAAGCSRSYWRQQADDRTYEILRQKANDPRWSPPRIDLQPDPRSRFFDPHHPDCPPLPPDDPTAHQYMHWVHGMKGYKHWHQFGDTATVENPHWLEPYGLGAEVVEGNAGKVPVLPEVQ